MCRKKEQEGARRGRMDGAGSRLCSPWAARSTCSSLTFFPGPILMKPHAGFTRVWKVSGMTDGKLGVTEVPTELPSPTFSARHNSRTLGIESHSLQAWNLESSSGGRKAFKLGWFQSLGLLFAAGRSLFSLAHDPMDPKSHSQAETVRNDAM